MLNYIQMTLKYFIVNDFKDFIINIKIKIYFLYLIECQSFDSNNFMRKKFIYKIVTLCIEFYEKDCSSEICGMSPDDNEVI